MAAGDRSAASRSTTRPRAPTPRRARPSWRSRTRRRALIAAVDDDGRLASLAVVVVQPAGAGGSVVAVPVSADASGGDGRRAPAARRDVAPRRARTSLAHGGRVAARASASTTSRSSTPTAGGGCWRRSARSTVDLPDRRDRRRRRRRRRGRRGDARRRRRRGVLTARDPDVPAAEQYPAAPRCGRPSPRRSVTAIDADASADGAAVDDGDAGRRSPAGRVGCRVACRRRAAPMPSTTRGASTSASLDRPSVTLVFGQIAPGQVAAPNPALTFRVEVAVQRRAARRHRPDQRRRRLRAISALLFVGANVLSVDTEPGDARRGDVDRGRRRDARRRRPTARRAVRADRRQRRRDADRRRRRRARSAPSYLELLAELAGVRADAAASDDAGDHRWLTHADDDARPWRRIGRPRRRREAGPQHRRARRRRDPRHRRAVRRPRGAEPRLVRTLVDEIEQAVRAATGRSPRRVEGVARAAVGADRLRRRRRPRVPRRDPPVLRDRAALPRRPDWSTWAAEPADAAGVRSLAWLGIVARSGAVAQLVERFHGMEEVRGSIPLSSTRQVDPRSDVARLAGAGCGADGSPATKSLTQSIAGPTRASIRAARAVARASLSGAS